jgi:DNA polymerase-3 subunit gamma/tau
MHLTQNCQVVAVDAATLTLGFANAGARDSFVSAGCDEVLRQAAIDVVGSDWRIETIVDPGAQPAGQPTITRPAVDAPPAPPEPEPARWGSERSGPPAAPEAAAPAPAPEPATPADRPASPGAMAAAREAIQQTRPADHRPAETGPDWAAADAVAHPDDVDADHQGMSTTELLERELGARMIEEIRHQ